MSNKDLIIRESDDYLFPIAENLLQEPELRFIYHGVRDYVDEILNDKVKFNLSDEDITSFFETYILESNDFYYEFLEELESFKELNLFEQIEIIYLFLKEDLPSWVYEETEFKNKKDDENNDIGSNEVGKVDIINERFEVESLYRMYNREQKELELAPDYQRGFVWKPTQKSRLIESMLIGIPLPTFYLDTRNEDLWVVIDGVQRLTTIFKFLNNEFKLTNLEYLNLKGKKWKDLDRKYQRKIEKFPLLCNLIRPGTPSSIATSIFQRINTLGTKLEIQEIRNAMFIGKSTELLNNLATSKEFVDIINDKKRTTRYSKRKEDHAIILRYLAFKLTHYLDYGQNNMPLFLEETMARINKMENIEIKSLENTFLECMKKAKILFEKDHFAKPRKRKEIQNPISKTIFESICFSLDQYTFETIEKYHLELRSRIYDLYNDQEFIVKTSIATNNPAHVEYRFKKIEELFKEVIGA